MKQDIAKALAEQVIIIHEFWGNQKGEAIVKWEKGILLDRFLFHSEERTTFVHNLFCLSAHKPDPLPRNLVLYLDISSKCNSNLMRPRFQAHASPWTIRPRPPLRRDKDKYETTCSFEDDEAISGSSGRRDFFCGDMFHNMEKSNLLDFNLVFLFLFLF